MPIIKDIEDPKPETIPYNSKHAIIGLWRRNDSGYNECYRQFRIDHPVTHKRFLGKAKGDDEDFKLKPFFMWGTREVSISLPKPNLKTISAPKYKIFTSNNLTLVRPVARIAVH